MCKNKYRKKKQSLPLPCCFLLSVYSPSLPTLAKVSQVIWAVHPWLQLREWLGTSQDPGPTLEAQLGNPRSVACYKHLAWTPGLRSYNSSNACDE